MIDLRKLKPWQKLSAPVAAVAVVLILVRLASGTGGKQVAAAGDALPLVTKSVVAGPGLVEPESEDVQVGSELAGKLKQVLVEEGDRVKKGQLLAVLVNDDYLAQVEAGRAQVQADEAAYEKVIDGARPQERRQYRAQMQQAEAVRAQTESDFARRQKLFAAGIVSRQEMDRAERDRNVAEDQYKSALQQYHLVDDRPRAEDIAAAKAQLDLARAQLAGSQAIYERTFLRAPLDGVILRKHHRAGESITNSSVTPDPVFTMGNIGGLRVRVDVDETDVSRVAVGQRVYVTAASYQGQRFQGRVIRIAGMLGHKNIQTDEPREKVDTKILETLVQLDPGVSLPVGLRVDAYIQTQRQ